MTSPLQAFLEKNTRLTPDDILDISATFTPRTVRRNDFLEEEGKVCKHLYFVGTGCLRLYEIDKKGQDITGFFALEDSLITAFTSFITQKPSRDFLAAYEPAEIFVIGREAFFGLTARYEEFKKLYDRLIEFALIHSQMRIYNFLGMEGIDKLKWVMEHEPKLLTRISSRAVASYLGMTNSTLSKLKARL
ncbi:Crp/Fnr family transcriptional regulator [Dinghuibacter silviterrae]|uniref:CRP-like cAMP-binding protein n=1 Tax=Dinghuibacter silviterrae TaxID=1539049 RepID=A0A4R8DUN2_9BACT|nr:cyclic nucleotide-binding domain-containing protein [Dinghuibacter silviterrae]TDX02100.1 CRP-like cAMP-binding protein [Dinghuibacter silviterrae]